MRFESRCLPLRQIIRSLLLDVRLCVYAMLAGELLRNGVLNFDRLDGFAEIGQGITPVKSVSIVLTRACSRTYALTILVGERP